MARFVQAAFAFCAIVSSAFAQSPAEIKLQLQPVDSPRFLPTADHLQVARDGDHQTKFRASVSSFMLVRLETNPPLLIKVRCDLPEDLMELATFLSPPKANTITTREVTALKIAGSRARRDQPPTAVRILLPEIQDSLTVPRS